MTDEPDKKEIITLDIHDIDEPPLLLHPEEDAKTLEELAQSMRTTGQRQPIEVREINGRYQVIDGYRRWKAAKTFGHKTIEAVVRVMTDKQAYLATAVANAHRTESDPIKEGELFAELYDKHDMSIGQISDDFAKTGEYVKSRLALVTLPPIVQGLIRDERLSLGSASQLYRMDSDEQKNQLAHHMLDQRMTVREAERFVDEILHWQEVEKKIAPPEVLQQAAIEPKFHCEYCTHKTTYGNIKNLLMCKECANHVTYLFEKERLDMNHSTEEVQAVTPTLPPGPRKGSQVGKLLP